MKARNILVTAALPYANGPIHLGHLVEYLQTDIWARFQRLRGNQCLYVCAEDAHGTPIMLRAQKEDRTPQELIDEMAEQHQRDFADFNIDFAHYHTTHSDENRELSNLVYERLRDGGHIARRTIEQAYDPEAQMFLPDRFIRGTCPIPKCGAEDQYGDSCEVCGSTYSPSELIDARSVISGKAPVTRESEHVFFKLGDFEDMLREWTQGGGIQPEVRNKLSEWFEAGLKDWDISRDAPYWGFEIPDAPGKYFYVWLDAPIGYMASFKAYCDKHGVDFDSYWGPDSDAEVHHFIGKDIAYFHCLFWPAMLKGAGIRLPTAVHCHGFLTVDGTKMSKSRGTFINARTYLDHLHPEYLRYYYAAKLSSGIDDIDLNLEDFRARVNADLVNRIVNIASRCAGFITKRFDGVLSDSLERPELYDAAVDAGDEIAGYFDGREFSRALRKIAEVADTANAYIDERKPWALAKSEDTLPEVQAVCTLGLNMYRVIMTYLKPVVPTLAADSEAFLQSGGFTWDNRKQPLLNHTIATFKPLMQRVDPKDVEAMVGDSKVFPPGAPAKSDTDEKVTQEKSQKKNKPKSKAGKGAPPPVIQFDDFAKVDLRVAVITAADHVEGADKLLQLTVDIGGTTKNIFAGIKSAYPEPSVLVGKHIVVVANLAPRKMRFGMSEGMAIAAGPGGDDIFLISPDNGAKPGMKVS